MSKLLGAGEVIYLGAEPTISPSKKEARAMFSLPNTEHRRALAVGFRTNNKGWDILERMDIPEGWIIVVNSIVHKIFAQNICTKYLHICTKYTYKKNKGETHFVLASI